MVDKIRSKIDDTARVGRRREKMKISKDEIKYRASEAIALDKLSSDTSMYVDFAFYLLDNNIESKNIYILAGLENDSYDDKIHYFKKILEELQINIPENERIDFPYAKGIARQVLNDKIDPVTAVYTFVKLYTQTEDSRYLEFLEISDGIDLLEEGYKLVPDMDKDNCNEYIKHAFELFLIFAELELPENFYKQRYCKKCLKRVSPIKKIKRHGLFGKKYTIEVCPECGADDFYWTRYNHGKDLYLKEIHWERKNERR